MSSSTNRIRATQTVHNWNESFRPGQRFTFEGQPQEVFLPYMLTGNGEQTMYEAVEERKFMAIESKEKE